MRSQIFTCWANDVFLKDTICVLTCHLLGGHQQLETSHQLFYQEILKTDEINYTLLWAIWDEEKFHCTMFQRLLRWGVDWMNVFDKFLKFSSSNSRLDSGMPSIQSKNQANCQNTVYCTGRVTAVLPLIAEFGTVK